MHTKQSTHLGSGTHRAVALNTFLWRKWLAVSRLFVAVLPLNLMLAALLVRNSRAEHAVSHTSLVSTLERLGRGGPNLPCTYILLPERREKGTHGVSRRQETRAPTEKRPLGDSPSRRTAASRRDNSAETSFTIFYC